MRTLRAGPGILLLFVMGCGGAGGGLFDVFNPSPASEGDFEGKTFKFSWLPDGNPLDSFIGEMTIKFSEVGPDGRGTLEVEELDGGVVRGTMEWRAPVLKVTLSEGDGGVPVSLPLTSNVEVEADKDDGRILLRNSSSRVEAASDP